MATRRASQLTIAYASDWKKQSAWDVPLANGDLDRAFPATSRNYIDVEETIEDVLDCTGEDFLFELVTAETARLTIDFDVDPDVLAGLTAFAFGVAAAPTGGTSEVQTETVTATGGYRTFTITRGADAQTTGQIPWNANAAAIQTAIDALSNVEPGDITVAGAGPFTYTFGGTYANQDVNLIAVNTFFLTGGTSTMVVTTGGVGLEHDITRLVAYTLPLMTLYIGFRGSDKQPLIFKNIVVNSIRVRSASREKVTCTVELIGSAELDYAVGYTMPECTDIIPIRFGDCSMEIGGVDYIAQNLGREFEFFYQNDVNPQFDGSGVYATRHERADVRPAGFNLFILGEPGDNVFNAGKARLTQDVRLQLGPDGRFVAYRSPQGLVKLAPTRIRFGGDPPESEIALVVRPKKVKGNADTPLIATATVGITETLLTAA